MNRIAKIVAAMLVVMAAAVTTARADVATARQHFQRGKVLFDLQKYLEAANEYELAYEAKDDPALLYNIGQSYRLGGEYQKALGAYRSYLRNVPDSPNRNEVQAHIEDMQRLLDEQRRSREAPAKSPTVTEPAHQPTATPPPTQAPVSRPAPQPSAPSPMIRDVGNGQALRIAGIATGVFGVVALATGTALELVAKSDNDKLDHPTMGTVFSPSLESSIKNDQAAGITLLAVGGAAVAVGATLLALGVRRHHPVAVIPAIAPTAIGLALTESF